MEGLGWWIEWRCEDIVVCGECVRFVRWEKWDGKFTRGRKPHNIYHD